MSNKDMMLPIKTILLSLLNPKAILFGVSAFVFGYIYVTNWRNNLAYGCYDCGFDIRPAFFVLIAVSAFLVGRNWSAIISLFASLKVFYTLGYWAFWNAAVRYESISHLSTWAIVKDSVIWSYELNAIWFVELLITSVVSIYTISFLWKSFSQKLLQNKKLTV